MIPKEEWIWSRNALGYEHVLLASHANFSETTTVGKYCINTMGEILSTLDFAPTEVFGKGLYYQSVVFQMKKNAKFPQDVDYEKGPILTKKYNTYQNAMGGHLNLCEIYARRSCMKEISNG